TTPTLSEAVDVAVIVPETVEPFAGLVMETVGGVVSGGVLLTVTVTGEEVVRLPAASRATAVSVCVPLEALVVFQLVDWAAAVSSTPRLSPSGSLSTSTTPTLSEAVDVAVMVPETVEPVAGLLIETVGGVVSDGGGLPLPM